MGLFSREKRGIVRTASEDSAWWREVFDALMGTGGRKTASGTIVNAESAQKVTAVFACVRVLSETVASLPRNIYERLSDGGKQPAKNHSLYPIITRKPNSYMTSFDMIEMSIKHLNLRGNWFSWIGRNGGGKITTLIPLHPDYVTIEVKNDEIFYIYRPPVSKNQAQKEKIYTADEIWHTKFFSDDGIVGVTPIHYAAEAIGLASAAEKFGAEAFSRRPVFTGIFQSPKGLSEIARKNFKESIMQFKEKKRQETILLEDDIKWQATGMTNEDAQYVLSRGFQIEEIARAFRVPCVLIGHPDKTMTYSSSEQFFSSFITHSIRPWLVRLEQSMNTSLLTEQEQEKYFIEFKADGLLRGDTLARYQAYAQAIQNLIMSPNEVRALENMNPREGGDEYINPNVMSASPEFDLTKKNEKEEEEENASPETKS